MTRKKIKEISKKIVILLIFSLCIDSYSAIVSDNDGSAFVTKAEFETLKKNFADQITNYNDSIDNKIDGAIASYLAGVQLAKKVVLDNNYATINPTWMRNKHFDKSKKGTKYTVFISFTEAIYGLVAPGYMTYCFEGTATSWYVNKKLVKNEDDPEYLYRIQKKKIGPFENQWSLQDLIQSDYSMTIGGGAAGGRGGDVFSVDRLAFPDHTQFKKEDRKYFGTWYSGLPIAIWSVNDSTKTKQTNMGYINGSDNGKETLAITAIAKDIPVPDDSMFYLAGGTVASDTMYCLNIASISELGDYYVTAKSNAGGSRQFYMKDGVWGQYINWSGGYYNDQPEISQQYYGNIETEIYRHVLNELNASNLLNETITQAMNEKVYYYSGCPICSTDAIGTVSFKIKFKNTAGARTKWALDSKQFSNAANPGNCGDIEDCSETTFLANDGATITVSFSTKKDKTYWIKCEPESGFTSIEFDGDITFVGE